jgi:uncharacterized repeat protein (TIGR01451 family)
MSSYWRFSRKERRDAVKRIIKTLGGALLLFLLSSWLIEARLDDAGQIDDLNVGDTITLRFGVPQSSPNQIPYLADTYPDYIDFGEMSVTIIEKGEDTGLTLSPEEKVEVLEAAIDWAENACEEEVLWEGQGGHRGGFPTKAYHYAYRKIVLGQQDAPYNYDEWWMPQDLPNMEFGEYVDAPAEPPAGSGVLPGPEGCCCRVGLGIGEGYVAAGQQTAIRFHYTEIPQYDSRGYGGYRMPTSRYFFYFDPYIVYEGEFYQPLGWRKVNKPDWAEKEDMRGGKNWKQRFSFLPGTVIKCEFFPSPGWDWNGWGYPTTKGPIIIEMDEDEAVFISIWPAPDLEVMKRAYPDPVEAGEQLTYTLCITNTGNLTLTATVIDILPNHVTTTRPLVWYPVIAAPSGVWTKRFTATVEMGYSGPLTNIVQVTTEEGATGVYTETSLSLAPQLTVTKRAAPAMVQPGGLLTYTIVVQNTGNTNANGVTITDTVPVSTAFASADAGGTLVGDRVWWTGKTIPAGGSLMVRFTVHVDSPLPDGTIITNADYGVTCAEGVSAIGSPVTSPEAWSIYLPLVVRDR